MISYSKLLFILGSLLLWGFYWVPFGITIYDHSLFFGELNQKLIFTFPYAFLGIFCLSMHLFLRKEKIILAPKQLNLMIYSLILLTLPLVFSMNASQSISYFPFLVVLFLGFFARESFHIKSSFNLFTLGVGTGIGIICTPFFSEGISSFALGLGGLLFILQVFRMKDVRRFHQIILIILFIGGMVILKQPQILIVPLFLMLFRPAWFFQEKRPKSFFRYFYSLLLLGGTFFAWPTQFSFSFGSIIWGIKNIFLGIGPGQYHLAQAIENPSIITETNVLSTSLLFLEWGIVGVSGFILFLLLILRSHKKESHWFWILIFLGITSTELLYNGNSFIWFGLLFFLSFESPVKDRNFLSKRPRRS